MSELEANLLDLLAQVAARRDDNSIRERCIHALHQLVLRVCQGRLKLRAFGSSVNGFGTRFSDLDISCYLESGSREEELLATQEVRETLVPMLHQDPDFQVMEEIWAARIPIVRLVYQQCLDVDLSFCNTEPFPNTKLLKTYSMLDPKVKALTVLVKLWAQGEHVCGPKEGHLSSYALNLMTLYFLQADELSRMPCLPTEAFQIGGEDSSALASAQWSCRFNVLDLLHRFFYFYASSFFWGEEVVSVRIGERLNISHDSYKKLNGNQVSQRLHIEDPFLLKRNLNCVLKGPQESILYSKLCDGCYALGVGMLPAGFAVVQELYSCKKSPLELYIDVQLFNVNASQTAAARLSTFEAHAVTDGNGRDTTIKSLKPTISKETSSESESTREPTTPRPSPEVVPRKNIPLPEEVPITWLCKGLSL